MLLLNIVKVSVKGERNEQSTKLISSLGTLSPGSEHPTLGKPTYDAV